MCAFVLSLLLVASFTIAAEPATQPVVKLGDIEAPECRESSGIIESRKYPGVFWTHNDSGNPPVLFAIDRNGKSIGTITVGATNRDWEDIATDDEGHLYIAETGNNSRVHRQIAVYMIDEPDPRAAKATEKAPLKKTWQLRFPQEPFDIESLFIWQKHAYLVSKFRDGTPASMYRFALETTAAYSVLEHVADLPIRMPCTAADMSRDGKFIVVLTITGPYLFEVDGNPIAIGKTPPLQVAHFDPAMEGACFVKEGVLATSERRPVLLFPFEAFRP